MQQHDRCMHYNVITFPAVAFRAIKESPLDVAVDKQCNQESINCLLWTCLRLLRFVLVRGAGREQVASG